MSSAPFNVALLLCGASILGLLVSQGKRFEIDIDCFKDGIDPRIDRRAIGCNLFLFTSTSAMETSYIYYSWKRAGGIIDRVYPRNGKFVHCVVRASPFQTMTHVLFFLTYCILCAMKWALWRNDVQEKSTAVGRVSGRSRSKAVSETKSAPKSTTLEPPQSQNDT
ncbi:hypothetical protein HDU79_007454 [Rhizoclosmatium sp. JEL0117]|nr:hypothetical protein HDU79_007454 [Rhizoclosmatium sp. JEL0117]